MNLSRVAKTGSALLGAQGILLISQLVLPPLFLARYGVTSYGEWLALSAAASYLGTLNFGLHNFANTQVSIHHSRGEAEDAASIQATAFAILLLLVGGLALAMSSVFWMPLPHWLHLHLSSGEASLTVYWLGLQVLVRMIFGFLQGAFLVTGVFHRGAFWSNILWTASLVATVVCILLNQSFSAIAAWQLVVNGAFCVMIAVDLKVNAPVAFPRLRHVQWRRAMAIIKPSGHFGMLFSATFLVYQLPVLIMQRMLGPAEVVAFSVSRTIYSMARQLLTSISAALGPEIVELYGLRRWNKLLELYSRSERIVFALIPTVAFGTFLATPVALTIWLHRPQLYHFNICLLLACISAVAGLKEHKYQFQISVNEHSEMARFVFGTYIGMVVLIVPAIWILKIEGFLLLWLITEAIQASYIVALNQKLFGGIADLNKAPLFRLMLISVGAGIASASLQTLAARMSLAESCAIAALATAAFGAIGYLAFDVRSLQTSIVARFHKPAATEGSPAR